MLGVQKPKGKCLARVALSLNAKTPTVYTCRVASSHLRRLLIVLW
jgi:hypothetical protein